MTDCLDALKQREGESDFEYHRRLVYGKLVDKTLADYDYSELSPYIYGKEYSCDVARRLLYGSCKTLQLLDEDKVNNISDKDVLTELDEKRIELQKERQRFYDQRREYNKSVAKDGRLENLYDHLAAAADRLPESVGRVFDFSEGMLTSGGVPGAEAVLVFSDWHYGLEVSNVFNEYNTDICKQRVSNVVEKAIQRCQLYGCEKVHIVVLGDLFHGGVHTSVRVASNELVCDQIMQVSEILAQAILRIGQFFEVEVDLTYGNHGRTIPNKKESIHRDNIERLVGWWLRERLKEYENITIHEESCDEFINIEVCGHHILASHGDLDSVKTSPRLLSMLFQKKYGTDIEYILLGDKHHRESFDELGVTAAVCGSLCGADQYANEKRLYSEPSQMLLIVNEEDGVDAEYMLKC